MNDKGEITYLKTNIKELLAECTDVELLYLIKGLLSKDAG